MIYKSCIINELTLFDLPFDILREILLKWLEEYDISQLDISLCNQKQRVKYLDIISCNKLTFEYPYNEKQNSISYAYWLLNRNIQIESFTLPCDFSNTFDFRRLENNKTFIDLKYLDCSKCNELNDFLFKQIVIRSRNIRKITIGSNAAVCPITNQSLYLIAKIAPYLLKLKFVQNILITDSGVNVITMQCKLLRNIQFHACLNIGDLSVNSISENCNHLEKFSISSNYSLTTRNCFNLISNCKAISSKSVTNMYLKCKYLKRLSIVNCDATISIPFEIDHKTNLLELQLSRNLRLSDTHLVSILYNIKYLLLLDLQDNKTITDNSLIEVASQLATLKSLNLSYCYQVTGISIIELIKYCKELEYLSLQACNVTDEVMLFISLNSLKLFNLNINWCLSVTEVSLRYISEGALNFVRNIDLCGCTRITKQSITILLSKVSSLTSINISYCKMIDSKDISIWNKDFTKVTIIYQLK